MGSLAGQYPKVPADLQRNRWLVSRSPAQIPTGHNHNFRASEISLEVVAGGKRGLSFSLYSSRDKRFKPFLYPTARGQKNAKEDFLSRKP